MAMTPSKLKVWMEKRRVTVVHIAAALNMSPATILRYLKHPGAPIRRTTEDGIERYVREFEERAEAQKKAGIGSAYGV